MFQQSHGVERILPYGGTAWETTPIWREYNGREMLFRYDGKWTISRTVGPRVTINGQATQIVGLVNGYLAYMNGDGETLFHDTNYGWVVSVDMVIPREFDYQVEDAQGAAQTVLAGTDFWASASLPTINDPQGLDFSPRGALRDTAPNSVATVIALWDYWQLPTLDQPDDAPPTGVYIAHGSGAIGGDRMIGYPAWLDADGGGTIAYTMAEGALYAGNAPGTRMYRQGGVYIVAEHPDGYGSWQTASDPVADAAWVVPFVYDPAAEDPPVVGPLTFAPTRCMRIGDGTEYVFPTARVI